MPTFSGFFKVELLLYLFFKNPKTPGRGIFFGRIFFGNFLYRGVFNKSVNNKQKDNETIVDNKK